MKDKLVKEVELLRDQVNNLLALQRFEEAEQHARTACRLAWDGVGEMSEAFGWSLVIWSDVYRAMDDVPRAEAFAFWALSVANRVAGRGTRLYANCTAVVVASRVLLGHAPDAGISWDEIRKKTDLAKRMAEDIIPIKQSHASGPHCEKCKSEMTKVRGNERWAIYRCQVCQSPRIKGCLNKDLQGTERIQAEQEMDACANELLTAEHPAIIRALQSMSTEELQAWASANMNRQKHRE